MKTKSNTKLLLFLLVFYVMLQLLWWGYLLSQLNKEVYQHKMQNMSYTTSNSVEFSTEKTSIEKKLSQRLWMILGEGSVFVLILAFGVYRLMKVMNAEAQLNKRQQNFLLSVTHELKSPLAAARLQLETVLKHKLDSEKQHKIIGKAVEDLDRLNTLTDNILTATQLENTNFLLNLKNENVSELVNRVVTTMLFKADNRKIITSIENDIQYNIDATAYQSIVINLLENALKYSDANTIVKINLLKENNKLKLQICDEGIGISENEKKEIFKKFYRVGSEETRKTKGTGLGLFIVKQLVELHKGQITIGNNTPQGSVFTVIC